VEELASLAIPTVELIVELLARPCLVLGRNVLLFLELTLSVSKSAFVSELAGS